jgi:uncharacterized RmlC-like cupin family protein
MIKEPKFLASIVEVSFDWDNFINHINSGIKQPTNQSHSDIRVNNVRFWDRLTVTTDYATEDFFLNLSSLSEVLNVTNSRFKTVMSVVSLTTSEKTTGRHCDQDDVVYLQCIGSVVWTVWHDDSFTDFTLNPGDAIYVPAFLDHHVQSLTPRAALSFIYEKKEEH